MRTLCETLRYLKAPFYSCSRFLRRIRSKPPNNPEPNNIVIYAFIFVCVEVFVSSSFLSGSTGISFFLNTATYVASS